MKRPNNRYAFLLLSLIYIHGCSQTSDDQSKIGPAQEKPSAEAAEKAFANRPLEFPADFPLPRYPGSTLEVTQIRVTKEPSHTVLLKTTDSIEKVYHFYARVLKADGWDVTRAMQREGYVMLGATRDRGKATLMITETRSGNTVISLFATKE